MSVETSPRVLLLATVVSPTEKKLWNLEIVDEFRRRGIQADLRSWKSPPLKSEDISQYTHVVTLTCSYYIDFIEEFHRFLQEVLIPTKKRRPRIQFLNDPNIVLWNSNKIYLNDLQLAKIVDIPGTIFFTPHQPLEYLKVALARRDDNNPIIVKPSVSASGRDVHMIKDPWKITQEDENVLMSFTHQPNAIGSIMVQQYEQAITKGEYSLVFLGHAFVSAFLKKPAEGDYRSNPSYGSSTVAVDPAWVPASAVEAAQRLLSYIETEIEPGETHGAAKHRISYARVDGAVRDDGTFALMEVELLEPSLGFQLEGGEKTVRLFCDLVTK